MKQTFFLGALFASTATMIVGSSVAVSSLLSQYPPLGGQAIRYALGAGTLAIVVRLKRLPLPRLSTRDVVLLVLLALTGLVGFNLCLLAALRYSDPAAVGATVGGVPVCLAVMGPLLRRQAPQFIVVCGAIVVSIGVGMAQGTGTTSPLGLLLSVGALLGEAAFTLLAVPLLPKLGPLVLSLYVCMTASLILASFAMVVDGASAFPAPTFPQLLALGYLAFAVTAGAFLAWYAGLARLGADYAGLFAGLIPVSALVCGMLVGTTNVTLFRAGGSLLAAGGVVVGSLRQPKRANTTSP